MTRNLARALVSVVVLGVGVAASAEAQSQTAVSPGGPIPKEGTPTIVRLTVDPASEPRPALKYHLLPRLSERKPGNAAPYYYRAILAFVGYEAGTEPKGGKRIDLRLDEWTRTPLEAFPKSEVRKALEGFRRFDDLREAAYREDCNWDWRVQDMEGTKSVEFLLEEVQQSRGVARWLAAKARLEIAEGRYTDALETLRVGYQFAHDIARPPFLISGLVGVAIAAFLDEQVHALIGAPGAPNLYWAFTELPRPLIDLRPSIEFELTMPFRVFPFLKDAETAQHSPEQWAELVSRSYHTAVHEIEASQQSAQYGWKSRLAATALAMRGYAQAKHDLVEAGYDRAKIEQMPVGQVVAVHEAWLCRYVADEMRKWTLVPNPDAQHRLKQVESQLAQDRYLGPLAKTREIVPIMSILFPATSHANAAMLRRDISIAANRVVEALRMHAFQNGGKLPKSLADISVVPVPPHPRSGEPFPYRLQGDKAILEVRRMTEPPAPMEESDDIFEITIARDRGKAGPTGNK